MKKILAFLSLFTSLSTLVCCALPALFVVLGFGAVFAGIVGTFPQLIWLSEHKLWIFSIGAVLLFIGGVLQWQARKMICPVGSEEACTTTKDWSRSIYYVAVILYFCGGFFAFIAPKIFS